MRVGHRRYRNIYIYVVLGFNESNRGGGVSSIYAVKAWSDQKVKVRFVWYNIRLYAGLCRSCGMHACM